MGTLTRKGKIALTIGLSVLGVFVIAAGCYIAYGLTHLPRSGGTVKFSANKIGTTAYETEKSVTINKHEFKYYNVKSSKDGGWILVDHTSYIINTDIQFGFRYKNANYVDIVKYGDASNDPRFMGEVDDYPGYKNYQVYCGIKLSINESVDPGEGIDIGVLMHWC